MVFSGLRNMGKLAVAEGECSTHENSRCIMVVFFRNGDVET